MAAPQTPSRPAAPPVFELTGGALCLDFANTWGDRGRPESDLLRDYRGLLAFGVQTRVLSAAAAARLLRRAARQPAQATAAFGQALALREAIYRLFAALAAGGRPAPADLAALNRALPAALARLRIAAGDGGFAWSWADPGTDLEAPVRPVARSAAELLISEEATRTRQCAAERCTWLFLDSSRNRARRWCDMKTCGNRAKARRHYRRQRQVARLAMPGTQNLV
jgi:predicted RNA-binding Zn ribbon-like protein